MRPVVVLALALLLGAALWSLPGFLRAAEVPLAWSASYDDAVSLGGAEGVPSLVMGGPLSALRAAGCIAGLLALVGLFLLLRRFGFDVWTVALALLLSVCSTLSMFLFAVPAFASFGVALTLLAAGLLLCDAWYARLSGMVATVLAALLGPVPAAHVLVLTGVLLLWRGWYWRAAVQLLLVAGSSALWWQTAVERLPAVFFTAPVVGVVAEFGAHQGIGVMEWIMAAVGIGLVWRRWPKRTALLWLLAFVYASLCVPGMMFAVALWPTLGAMALMHLFERRWHHEMLKSLALIAVCCGLLFSALSMGVAIRHAPPTPAIMAGIGTLRADDVVLTAPDVASWVRYGSSASVAFGPRLSPAETAARDAFLASVWYDRDLGNVTSALDGKGVNAVVVTRGMRRGQVWWREEEGLLFLLDNSEKFRKDFANSEIEVYRRR